MIITLENSNISRIWDRLYVGNYQAAIDVDKDNAHHIGWVLNCTADEIEYLDVPYKVLAIEDGEMVAEDKVKEGLDWIRWGLGMGHRVLVHCHAGMSRSVSFVAAHMYLSGFRNLDMCVKAVQERRPIAQPHPLIIKSFKQALKIYPYDTYPTK